MLFNSIDFFVFFTVVTCLYFALPYKFRWGLLLLASCYFYMSFIPVYILILALTIGVDYFAAIQIEKYEGKKRKMYLVVSIISTCAILFVFKYFNFFNANFNTLANVLHWNYPIEALKLILPIGLSFHTFQSLSYVIEVYRGNQKAEKNFGIYSLYVMFYPQLVAGPIERPQNMLHQFYEKHDFDYERVKSGLLLMLWGLFKKMVIADRLSLFANEIFNNPGKYHGYPVLVAIVFFAFQIYCDFSGYSDIAIGAARVMGFKLMTNFNVPYLSSSVNEFWHRWHISLSTWFRDYVYIPLGGNRAGKFRRYYNLLITFMISGLWHGASWTFIIWGALHGFVAVLEILFRDLRETLKNTIPGFIHKLMSRILVFSFVSFAWVFFRAKTFHDAIVISRSVFVRSSFSSVFDVFFSPFIMALFVVVVGLMFFIEYKAKGSGIDQWVLSKAKFVRWFAYCSLLASVIVLGNFGKIDFIYFQF